MAYTLWHTGVLIGETDFEGETENGRRTRRHLSGAFRPTAYGRRMLPRMSGMLTAASDLKDELARRGLSETEMEPDAIANLFDTTPAGARIVDIGRALSEIELRDPSGAALEFASIAFIDLAELDALARKLECDTSVDLSAMPPQVMEFIVSVTLRTNDTNRQATAR